jgi:hypothetical protein
MQLNSWEEHVNLNWTVPHSVVASADSGDLQKRLNSSTLGRGGGAELGIFISNESVNTASLQFIIKQLAQGPVIRMERQRHLKLFPLGSEGITGSLPQTRVTSESGRKTLHVLNPVNQVTVL